MLAKRQLGNGKVEVTFTMPELEGVTHLYLVGDFNDWSIVSQPMTRSVDGSWGATLRLDENRSYQFRYFDNNGHWHNDWKADAYVPNQFDGDNSVVSATAESSAVAVAAVETGAPKPKRRAPARKAAAGEAGAEAAPKKRAAPRKKKAE
ncbi:MAG: isoamylase early set domain-containing protein [Anaerolineales bacterium]|nr:isoamylase early set domain-containing protein [Anaerolineales bacterium]